MPEFRDAKLDDLEFRADGKIVRKDRWERGIFRIANMVGCNSRDGFEIDEVVENVRLLVKAQVDWMPVIDTESEDIPTSEGALDIELFCGSVLNCVTFEPGVIDRWIWGDVITYTNTQVKNWRLHIAKEVQS
jgi:hypothetical protein